MKTLSLKRRVRETGEFVKRTIHLQKGPVQGEHDIPAGRFFKEVGLQGFAAFRQRNLRMWATTSCGALM
jgi:hypothetical protein